MMIRIAMLPPVSCLEVCLGPTFPRPCGRRAAGWLRQGYVRATRFVAVAPEDQAT